MAGLLLTSTPGDRQELRRMLHALSPLDRVRFLCECGVVANKPGLVVSAHGYPLDRARSDDAADEWVTRKVYADLLMLASQFGVDLDAAADRLAGHVTRPAGLRENKALVKPLRDALRVRAAV